MDPHGRPQGEPYGPEYFEEWYADRSWEAYSWLLGMVVRESQPGRVLDLGAGTGLVVEGLQRWGIEATGLEGSEAGVAAGLARMPELDLRRHDLAEPLPFEDRSVSTVVLNQVFEHLVADTGRALLKEVARVLSAGGTLILTAPSRHNAYERVTDPTHVNMLAPRELREELRSAGFREVIPFDEPLPFLGSAALMRKLAKLVFLLIPVDRLSATTNVIARV